ncbi:MULTISPECIES: aKG-HExxH-type peptide beta-hydroxylase [unclassified Sporolactobacillus]|uniref:aKG-HExxH-type peptide beta-hydroxylase n=1 Tax=unclassified Sporolactobacillus TaxID=2628533 RepID=UPI0023674CE7|nr:HEXXH motif-containing putative peptide modification protein [Sporolactobacillus sp. CQH2019]MDD9150469.1 HEXXH motif-containing putative peptide modification protein [Sporolactobacillus sp. CQH2019]
MLNLLGLRQNLKIIQVLSKSYCTEQDLINYQGLKKGYKNFLREIQPDVPHSKTNEINFVESNELTRSFVSIFGSKSLLDDVDYDLGNSQIESNYKKNFALKKTRSAMIELGEKYESFKWLFNLAMDSVFYAPSQMAKGGTTSDAVGVLWVNPSDNWNKIDYYELLIHELCHTMIFLYEWQCGIFSNKNRLTDSETFAMSAIRGKRRPLDKAYHSAIVATEILMFRKNIIRDEVQHVLHPETHELISMTLVSLKSVKNIGIEKKMLNERAIEMLDICLSKLKLMEGEISHVHSHQK